MKSQKYHIVIYKEGAEYVAQCLDFDISSFGSTQKEASENITEAIELYLEDNSMPKQDMVSSPKLIELELSRA